TVRFDLKDYLQKELISQLLFRVVGSIVIAGAGGGAATGLDNPESLITDITARHSPTLGLVSRNSLTPRGLIQQGIFDRGYSIHGTAITDVAATVPVDYQLPLVFKQPGSVNPVEWGLPMSLFTSYNFDVRLTGREALFSGGTNTWDLTNLTLEIWADYDYGVAGSFNAVEEFERTIDVLSTKPDLQDFLEKGFLYTHLLYVAERDNVKDDTIINSITVQSAGRIWTPQGDKNAPLIQRWTRERYVNNAAESLTGTYFIGALRDGMYTRAIDALTDRVEQKFDVTLGGGAIRRIRIHGRRIIPKALQVRAA
ncbi:MAG: hypothetical protein ACREQ5_07790, partial [Candidatus Dormibacteria bacterium]